MITLFLVAVEGSGPIDPKRLGASAAKILAKGLPSMSIQVAQISDPLTESVLKEEMAAALARHRSPKAPPISR